MAKQKYYVIWKGKNPGIYSSWTEAKNQIDGFTGAVYKSFESAEDAAIAFSSNPSKYINSIKKNESPKSNTSAIDLNSICVDAACSGNPGDLEYRGVLTSTGKEIFRIGPLKMGTNNIGEFLAIVHGLAYLEKLGRSDIIIYTDSATAISWIKNKRAKTKLERCKDNIAIFDLLDRAYAWLDTHTIKNKILKWETAKWGEIKADFGRK